MEEREEFGRSRLLLGADGMERLWESTVAVFGIGGVGSHCAQALARSGVGHLILIDSDEVAASNINRQCVAYHSTLGRKKTHVMRDLIRDICPQIRVDTSEVFVLEENLEPLLAGFGRVDYIVDAIDTVSAKLALAVFAKREGIPLISSMGTGNKLYPELFELADIYETSVCPLCRVMRRELKKRGIEALRVLYSRETPLRPREGRTPGLQETDGRPAQEAAACRPVPGSVSFVPPAAGLILAGAVVRDLAGV